jgi:flavin-binding protein dodecin
MGWAKIANPLIHGQTLNVRAVEKAGKSLKALPIGEVTAQDVKIENGKVVAYRTKLSVSFCFHDELPHHE